MKNRLSKTMKHLFLGRFCFLDCFLPPRFRQKERQQRSVRRIRKKRRAEQTLTMGAYFDNPYQHTLQSDYKAARRTSRDQWTDTVWQNDVLDAKITVWRVGNRSGSWKFKPVILSMERIASRQKTRISAGCMKRWPTSAARIPRLRSSLIRTSFIKAEPHSSMRNS